MNETELERLMVRLQGDGTSYQKMLANAERQTSAFSERVQVQMGKTGMHLKGFASATGGGIMGLLGLGGAVGTASSAISRFASREKTQIGFEALIGDADLAKKTLADLYKFAADTPFESPEILAAAKQMIGFGESAQNIVPTMRMLGDVSSALEIPLGELTRVYGTLRSQGRAFTVDINQFALRGIPVWEQLELQFGKTNAEVRKMVEEGKVGFPEIERAFKSATGPMAKFTGGMEKASKSLDGLFSTLKDNLGMTLADIGEEINNALDLKGLVKDAGEVMGKASELFKGLSSTTKQWIVYLGLGAVALGAFLLLLPVIKGAFVSLFLPVALLFSPTGLLVAGVAAAVAGVIYFTDSWGALKTVIKDVADQVENYFKPAVEGIGAAIRVGDLELAFKIGFAAVFVEWQKLVIGMTKAWNDFKDFFVDAWYDAQMLMTLGTIDFIGYMKKEHRGLIDFIFLAYARLGDALGMTDFANTMRSGAKLSAQEWNGAAEAAKKAVIDAARAAQTARTKGRKDDLTAAEEALKQAEEELAKLSLFAKVKEAFRNAFKSGTDQAAAASKAMEQPIVKELHIVPKFDAAGFNTVEAAARVQEWQDRIGLNTVSAKEARGRTSVTAPTAQGDDVAGGDWQRNTFDDIRQILMDIRDGKGADGSDFGGGDF